MAEPSVEPTIRGYLHVLRAGRWWIAAFSLLGLGISLAVTLTATKEYSATAQLLVQSTANVNLSTDSNQTLITTAEVQTELELVTSAPVQQAVAKKLGGTPGVTAAQVGQTDVIAISAVSPSPASAALIANTYAKAFVAWTTATASANLSAAENQLNAQIGAISKEISRLPADDAAQESALSNQQAVLKGQLAQLQVTGATASTGLELVTPATAPGSPSSPKPVQDVLVGLIAGLAIGIAGAFVRDSLDDTLNSGEAVERLVDAPVLATVPMVAAWRKKSKPVVIAANDPSSQPAEAYRSLRTSLQFARQDRPLRTILVTSPSTGDGKTATVVNLGAVFAQAGARVVLVSCDLRRPGLSEFSAPNEGADLAAVLAGELPLEHAVTPVPDMEGLWIVGTRRIVANPTELLAGQRMQAVIAELAERFDIVLIDSPPVLPVADAMILAGYADGVVLVVATGQTRRAELRRTREKLGQAGAVIVGAVLNKATQRGGYGYGYGYYGGYRPYALLKGTAAAESAAQPRRQQQNGSTQSSGQYGRHGR
jgi:polysaccharide biosynthesis transport protein